MQHALLALSLLLLTACQISPTAQTLVYDGELTYPLTKIDLGSGLHLRHAAGPPCDHMSSDRPPIGSEGDRTQSIYEILDASGATVTTAPSMLSDPRYGGEFEAFYRKNDQVSIHMSPSARSILIVEDRSPVYPCRSHILLQQSKDGRWAWADLEVSARQKQECRNSFPSSYGQFPEIATIDDSRLLLRTGTVRELPYAKALKARR